MVKLSTATFSGSCVVSNYRYNIRSSCLPDSSQELGNRKQKAMGLGPVDLFCAETSSLPIDDMDRLATILVVSFVHYLPPLFSRYLPSKA